MFPLNRMKQNKNVYSDGMKKKVIEFGKSFFVKRCDVEKQNIST